MIALAKARGLGVVADAKPEDEELVRELRSRRLLPRGDGFVAAVRERYPDGVDGLYDTAILRGAALGAIRDGGASLSSAAGTTDETGARHPGHAVRVATVLERTDWLRELRQMASAGGSRFASPPSSRPSRRRRRTG